MGKQQSKNRKPALRQPPLVERVEAGERADATVLTSAEPAEGEPGCVYLYRNGERAVVNVNSVEIMRGLGWGASKDTQWTEPPPQPEFIRDRSAAPPLAAAE